MAAQLLPDSGAGWVVGSPLVVGAAERMRRARSKSKSKEGEEDERRTGRGEEDERCDH